MKLLIGIVIIVVAVSFAKDMLIKASVEKGVELITGLQLKIQSLRIGVIRTLVSINTLRVYNPAGYKDRIMLDMPEIYVSYDLPALLKGVIHLSEMRIDMKELVVVKNEKGDLNLNSLKVVQAQKTGKKPEAKEKGKMPEVRIDSLQLKIGKVILKDYSKGGAPAVTEFNLNLSERYTNITDPYTVVSLVIVKALMNTTIANITDFDLSGLKGSVASTLAMAQKVAQEMTSQVVATAQKTQEAVKGTSETLQKTTEGLKNVLTSPFASEKK